MKRIIDIPNELAEKEHWYTDKEMWTVIKAAQNGTPIPDNATTVDDVLEQIRNEIEQSRYGLVNDGLDLALKIIDRHMKGDSE